MTSLQTLREKDVTQGSEETLLEELMSWAQCHTDVAALCQLAVPTWVVAIP